jgi:general secretion pathway protein D
MLYQDLIPQRLTTCFKTPSGCNRLRSAWGCVSRRLCLTVIGWALLGMLVCGNSICVAESNSDLPVHIPILDAPEMADELISLNFDQTDIRTVLKTIGDITGINFVLDDQVRGEVTVMSPTKIRLGSIFSLLESILQVYGYAAIPSGDIVKIIPIAQVDKHNLPVYIGTDPTQIRPGDSMITQIMPLSYANATEVTQIVQPLLSADAKLTTYARTNTIVVTDTSSKIQHLAKVIRQLDVVGSSETMRVFALEHASAQVLSQQVEQMIQKGRFTGAQANRTRSSVSPVSSIKLLPDLRTNALVVYAQTRDMAMIEQVIKQLDIPRPQGADRIHVEYMKNAQAKEVAESLTAAVANLRITGPLDGAPPIQVTSDEGTNALIISAQQQDFELIKEIIEKLDIVREQIFVEMLLVEISEDNIKEIGIDWATMDEALADSVRGFAATNFGPRVDFLNGDLEGLAAGVWKTDSAGNLSIGAILNLLEKESSLNILSTPQITTSNHQKAMIFVGENTPYDVNSRITETDPRTPTVIKTFEYNDVGITLNIVPHVSQGGMVRLEVDTEFSKLVPSTSTDTPTTAKRLAQTTISMQSGSTAVIGGLIRDDKSQIEKKIPLLGDLPLVGALFRHNRDQIQKTNLLIFITPHVLAGQEEMATITAEKRKEMEDAVAQD